ncbi:MAG: hypothetical protein ACP5RN_07740 [Armatimonadota bacterium]
MKKIILMSLLIIIPWMGCCTVRAQLSFLHHTADEREQYFRAFRLVWSFTEVRTLNPAPVDPKAIRQEVEFLKRELRARGITDVAAVQKQLEKEYEQAGARSVLVGKGNWEIEWGTDSKGKEFLFVSGIRRFHEGDVLFQDFYGDGWGIEIGTPESGRPGLPPLVWCCTGHCARYPALNDGGLDIGADELSLIACLNALRINGGTGWQVINRTKDSIRVRKRDYLDTYGVFELDMVLDLKHDGMPNRIVKRSGGYEGQILVTGYTQSNGYWLPTSIKSVFRTRKQSPGMVRERMWRLNGIEPKRGVSLQEISALPAVRYWGMRDLRAYGCNLTLSEVLSGDKDVYYQWEGRLPAADEVKAMLTARQSKRSKRSAQIWWRIIPPLLLITIGVLWYWRLRRAEGKK